MKTSVAHFGLHSAGGLEFLLQAEDSAQTAAPWSHANPFEVVARRCPHAINLSLEPESDAWDEFQHIARDALIVEMLPIPKRVRTPAFFGLHPDDEEHASSWMAALEQLSSPTRPSGGLPMWLVNPKTVAGDLMLSNLSPVALSRAGPRNTETLLRLGEAAVTAPRPLVVIGSNDTVVPPFFRRLRTSLGTRPIPDLDWRAIGARVCREHMLGHQPYTSP